MRIAQIRSVPRKGDLTGNHGTLQSILSEIATLQADVVVTPECFLDGYVSTEDFVDAGNIGQYAVDPASDVYVRGISDWACRNAAWVVLGCSRFSPQGVYNSALIFDRQGRLHGTYDKIHCQMHDAKYLAGEKLAAFDSDFGRFGIMICADRRWPETVRSLALQGARIIFNPTYGSHDERNLRMMQTRSYESEIFIAFTHPRQSLLTGPSGEILCNDTGETLRYSITEIDLQLADVVRCGASAHLKDRRPGLYSA